MNHYFAHVDGFSSDASTLTLLRAKIRRLTAKYPDLVGKTLEIRKTVNTLVVSTRYMTVEGVAAPTNRRWYGASGGRALHTAGDMFVGETPAGKGLCGEDVSRPVLAIHDDAAFRAEVLRLGSKDTRCKTCLRKLGV